LAQHKIYILLIEPRGVYYLPAGNTQMYYVKPKEIKAVRRKLRSLKVLNEIRESAGGKIALSDLMVYSSLDYAED
jgi:hypothetical protein